MRGMNIKELIEEVHGMSMMFEKRICEIGWMGRLRNQNEDEVEARIRGRSQKIGDGIAKC
jgi:hypothetical protein